MFEKTRKTFQHLLSEQFNEACVSQQLSSVTCLTSYLSLRQAERRGELRLPPDGDVFAVVKLFLQLQPLVVGVNHPVFVFSPRLPVCKTQKQTRSVRRDETLFFQEARRI